MRDRGEYPGSLIMKLVSTPQIRHQWKQRQSGRGPFISGKTFKKKFAILSLNSVVLYFTTIRSENCWGGGKHDMPPHTFKGEGTWFRHY